MERFDALVIGGGPAGSTAALLLAQAGWSALLVERQRFPRRKVCGEYLSATNWPLFKTLGIDEQFGDLAGPPIKEVGILVGKRLARADLPLPSASSPQWGRALAREHLDALLVERAEQCGVRVIQPGRCIAAQQFEAGFVAQVETHPGGPPVEVHAPVVIAAHGSWDLGALASQRQHQPPRGGDWLAFKAHFREASLPDGLMPLVSFADGYGGMAHCDGGRTSLSCCIRRVRFSRLSRQPDCAAGDAVLTHILDSCPALQTVLESAKLDGSWLSAGPIQPGIRRRYQRGIYVIGNAAGEAHPVVAEGISMAMQSAWLLARLLVQSRDGLGSAQARDAVGRAYSAVWRTAFAPRVRAATAIAHWAMRPKLVALMLPALQVWPSLLTWGARLSGKTNLIASAE